MLKKINFLIQCFFYCSLLAGDTIKLNVKNNMYEKKRILIISDSWNQIGGAEEVLDQVKIRLRNHHFEIAHMDLDMISSLKVPFWPGIRSANPFGLQSTIAQHIQNFKPDFILITFLGLLSYYAGQYCFDNNIPFTVFYPSRIPEICKAHLHLPLCISYYFVKDLLVKASKVLVPSQSLMRDLQQRGIGNVVTWDHGIDLSKFILPSEDIKKMAAKHCHLHKSKRPFYLYVGRLSKAKNIQAFLDIKLPGTKILVGPQDFGYTLANLANQYPDIVFAGPQRDNALLHYYQAADIFVFPSQTDSFGLVLLEALATGLPIVAFDVTGPRDIAPENSGISYLARSNSELEQCAIKAWKDLQEGKITKEQCRWHAQSFSWEAAVAQLLKEMQPTTINCT